MAFFSLDISQRFPSLELNGIQLTGKILGKGSDATVKEVNWFGTSCAAKQLHEILLEDHSPGGAKRFVDNFEKECMTWSKLVHPHIVQFLGVYFSPTSRIPMLILEKMDTSLRYYLEKHTKDSFVLTDKIYVLRQVAQALSYLHSRSPPLVHHDLSPNNVLLNEVSLQAKVTDFGMTRAMDPSKMTRKSSAKGTQAFMPPEALHSPPKYDEKLDVFSYGNVIVTTVIHDWPEPGPSTTYKGERLVAISEFHRRKQYLAQFTSTESEVFLPMVRGCLENRPIQRPTSIQLVTQMREIELHHPRKAKESLIAVQYQQEHNQHCQIQDRFQKLFQSDRMGHTCLHSVKVEGMPVPTTEARSVLIGKNLFVAGGIAGGVKLTQIVQVYNIDTGKWSTLPPAPQYLCEAVSIAGNLVLIGGKDSSTGDITSIVSTWVVDEQKWMQTIPPMRMTRLRPGVLLLKKFLFVFGGKDKTTVLDTFEVLDIEKNQWRRGHGVLPQPLWYLELGVFGDAVIATSAWETVHAPSTKSWSIPVCVLEDSVTNSSSQPIQWTPIADTPYKRSSLLTNSKQPVLIGGFREGRTTKDIHRYTPDRWEIAGQLSQPQSSPSVITISNNSFLVLGGCTDPHKVLQSLLNSVELKMYMS